jgi:hypothetical protein
VIGCGFLFVQGSLKVFRCGLDIGHFDPGSRFLFDLVTFRVLILSFTDKALLVLNQVCYIL